MLKTTGLVSCVTITVVCTFQKWFKKGSQSTGSQVTQGSLMCVWGAKVNPSSLIQQKIYSTLVPIVEKVYVGCDRQVPEHTGISASCGPI